ncbi:protein timeless-like isoform X2 [Amphiura filiformis]|uniref:protein timeless-like isoform X2 n=1 Tax=Amphiura filiformis TaxID=82378 RepID=UPI003B21E4E1
MGSGSSSCSSMGSGSTSSTIDGERAARELRDKLSQFALKFARKGLDRCILLCQVDLLKGLEDMCFLWVQNFFLPFADHPSVTYADIRHTVSSAVLSNLTYLACQSWQQFKMSMGKDRKKGQSNSKFKKLYLIMAVLRQLLSQLRRYSEKTLSEEEQKWFLAATETLCCTTNLRQLYPMLIRLFEPRNETVQYLRELIHGNSELLQLFNNTHNKHIENGKEVMLQHFTDFVDNEVISTYNHLLSSFSQNTIAENEAVFTFFYHIVIDLDAAEQLFKLPIFNNFANIWEAESPPVSQESLDLMDYIMFKYTELAMENPEDGLDIAKDTAGSSRKKPQKGKKRKLVQVESDEGTSVKKSKVAILNKMLQTKEEIRGLYCVGSCTESSDDDLP